jgi:phosphonopyruvate decarboxylase
MKVEKFVEILGGDFYTGVPDSQLKALCDYLMGTYGIDQKHHIIAANEGSCSAIGAGYYLATGKTPIVYLQNSGIGNIINPVTSLLNEKVYAVPMVFVVGWRGEPGTLDEPQHFYQGQVTLKLLEDMDIKTFIIGKETSDAEVANAMESYRSHLASGKNIAFIIRKGALYYDGKANYNNDYTMAREEVIQHIVAVSGTDPVVSTTGKASRELFETRVANGQSHKYDFLTVGSMGHSSSIALGIAINKPNTKVWCIDGDGAVLMHMGSLPLIGAISPKNLIHIVINNESHETVGGMPTVINKSDIVSVAKSCGYPNAVCVDNFKELDVELLAAKNRDELSMIEIKCSIFSRKGLGRPTTTPIENKQSFMKYLKTL